MLLSDGCRFGEPGPRSTLNGSGLVRLSTVGLSTVRIVQPKVVLFCRTVVRASSVNLCSVMPIAQSTQGRAGTERRNGLTSTNWASVDTQNRQLIDTAKPAIN